MRKLGSVLILCAATVCFSGCAWRNLGPCYGIGCPSYALTKSAPGPSAENTAAPKSQHLKAKAQTAKAAQPQQNPGQ